MRQPFAVLAVLAVPLLSAPVAAAEPVTETATAAPFRAELSYNERQGQPATGITMRLFRDAQLLFERRIADRMELWPIGMRDRQEAVDLIDLDGDGEPEAVFDFFTGGANCCVTSRLVDGSRMTRLESARGYRIKDVDGDGTPEFLLTDERFRYRYGLPGVVYLPPLRALRLNTEGELTTVTTEPALRPELRRDIVEYRRVLRRGRQQRDPIVALAATVGLAANYCSLRRCTVSDRLIATARRRGDASPGVAKRLRRDLKRFGYRTASRNKRKRVATRLPAAAPSPNRPPTQR